MPAKAPAAERMTHGEKKSGKNSGFSGDLPAAGAGRPLAAAFTATVDSNQVQAGQDITLQLTLSGNGGEGRSRHFGARAVIHHRRAGPDLEHHDHQRRGECRYRLEPDSCSQEGRPPDHSTDHDRNQRWHPQHAADHDRRYAGRRRAAGRQQQRAGFGFSGSRPREPLPKTSPSITPSGLSPLPA